LPHLTLSKGVSYLVERNSAADTLHLHRQHCLLFTQATSALLPAALLAAPELGPKATFVRLGNRSELDGTPAKDHKKARLSFKQPLR
jgi:hypothetical protein